MLSGLLSPEDCKRCQICCTFDSTDIWETPVIDEPTKKIVLENYNPAQEFLKRGDTWRLHLPRESDRDFYYCTMLNRQAGCVMGKEKPFDCKIWPLRVMNFEGRRVIVLSPVCPVMITRPMDKLCALAAKLAPRIFAEADKTPDMVKDYIENYPILFTEQQSSPMHEKAEKQLMAK